MRNFLIKHFALYHVTKICGIRFEPLRATTPLASSFLILIILEYYIKFSEIVSTIVFLSWFIFAYLMGFIYFKIKPIKYGELQDDDQRWKFGQKEPWNLDFLDEEEWQDIDVKVRKELKQKNRNVLPVLIPIILIITTITIYIKWDFLYYTFS